MLCFVVVVAVVCSVHSFRKKTHKTKIIVSHDFVFFFYSSKSVVFFINSVVETIVSANWITSNENNLRTSSAYWNHFAHGVAFT